MALAVFVLMAVLGLVCGFSLGLGLAVFVTRE